ncbi:MAG TPA: chemotaxis protein CheB [Pyrinomonadaceae bacterium]|jgi:two-component system chemotaxis response regulator CheB|nr:chemotaxis protein CheB [Pyrinomonadaceae bacterium]
MATRDTIVIGASAGGVAALSTLVSSLPQDLCAAVFIVLHIPTDSPSFLPTILARDSAVPVAHATHGEPIVPGRVYVAPPDRHLLIDENRIKLVRGPKENLHRPSIDALFRSAARWAGPRVIGVVLTGARDDGTVGMRAIKQRGGIAIVQDPLEASFASMPMSVMKSITVDYSLPLAEISPLLHKLSRETSKDERDYSVAEDLEIEAKIAEQELDGVEFIASVEKLGNVSRLTCPDCQGALWEMRDDDLLRFRCHVGHAYSAESLSNGQSQMLEMALWSAVRALEEQMILAKRIVARARKANHVRSAETFERRAEEAERNSSVLRKLLLGNEKSAIAEPIIRNGDEATALRTTSHQTGFAND